MSEYIIFKKVFRLVVIAGITALIIMLRKLSYNKKRRNTEKNYAEKRKLADDVILSQQEVRAKKKKSYAVDAADKTIDLAFELTYREKADKIGGYVFDFDSNIEALQEEFLADVYENILNIAQRRGGISREDIRTAVENVNAIGLTERKLDRAYLILLIAYTGKKPANDDKLKANKLNPEALFMFKRYYYEAMRASCRTISDVHLRYYAASYWHARILLDANMSISEATQLFDGEYIDEAEKNSMLAKCRALNDELDESTKNLRSLMSGRACRIADEELINENDIERLLAEADPELIDAKRNIVESVWIL